MTAHVALGGKAARTPRALRMEPQARLGDTTQPSRCPPPGHPVQQAFWSAMRNSPTRLEMPVAVRASAMLAERATLTEVCRRLQMAVAVTAIAAVNGVAALTRDVETQLRAT